MFKRLFMGQGWSELHDAAQKQDFQKLCRALESDRGGINKQDAEVKHLISSADQLRWSSTHLELKSPPASTRQALHKQLSQVATPIRARKV